jgi:hypothetical protein
MNTPTISKDEVAKLDYRPVNILLRAIDSFYTVYSQMYLPDSLKFDLQIGAENLVKEYMTVVNAGTITQTRTTAINTRSEASNQIYDIIKDNCIGKSESMKAKLLDEAAAWMREIIS